MVGFGVIEDRDSVPADTVNNHALLSEHGQRVGFLSTVEAYPDDFFVHGQAIVCDQTRCSVSRCEPFQETNQTVTRDQAGEAGVFWRGFHRQCGMRVHCLPFQPPGKFAAQWLKTGAFERPHQRFTCGMLPQRTGLLVSKD